MLFSSLLFLYLFLPVTLLGYYLSPGRIKNYWLLLTSLIFFAWGGVSMTALLLASIAGNYVFGLLIDNARGTKMARTWLATGISANILVLSFYKYADFTVENVNLMLSVIDSSPLSLPRIMLPIGISFYTFHSISYLTDIYRGKTTAQRNIFDLALYISMFSQLIAGPIIRYSDVWDQLKSRGHSLTKFTEGVERFLIGLARKVLLANNFAKVADTMFNGDIEHLGAFNAWAGLVCYTLQIYHDFAGYSDMAIGLGKMFGFDFKENFNFPYVATSVKEFWRRWHISLSSFFRDYVYVPLGGNRKGTRRTYVNLLGVFFLTGLWHGASWNFVIWGMFHGFFMVMERLGLEKMLDKSWRPLSILYTLLVVMFAWVLFRADTLKDALHYWTALLDFKTRPEQLSLFMRSMNREVVLAMLIALLGAFGFFPWLKEKISTALRPFGKLQLVSRYSFDVISSLTLAGMLALCTLYLIAGTYNPFIYYRF